MKVNLNEFVLNDVVLGGEIDAEICPGVLQEEICPPFVPERSAAVTNHQALTLSNSYRKYDELNSL